MSRLHAAVLGATGAVGQRFVQLLADHPDFELSCLAASERSADKTYAHATNWILDAPMPEAVATQDVVPVGSVASRDDVQVVFSALPSALAGPLEPEIAAAGKAVFTNASPHRMDADVPLLIAEVNPDHLLLVHEQGGPGMLIANGNCSGIILTLALAPLLRNFGLQRVEVTTLQGLSGAGYPGVPSLDVVDNVVPFIGGEEDKLHVEPHKMLGAPGQPASFPVGATCTRVPVREGHLESVTAILEQEADMDALVAAWSGFAGPPEVAGLHTSPHVPIQVASAIDRPQPRRDRDAGNGMTVTVGRIRPEGNTVRFLALGHNTIRGAAGQSIQNAELTVARGLLDHL